MDYIVDHFTTILGQQEFFNLSFFARDLVAEVYLAVRASEGKPLIQLTLPAPQLEQSSSILSSSSIFSSSDLLLPPPPPPSQSALHPVDNRIEGQDGHNRKEKKFWPLFGRKKRP
eukprot:TRINITY_DN28122_c0_g1_i1.p1 TRINITY_DN28122_c0_g1~~TRINITY_DN28122_c0_g1_i1.p1  ORF type:complete len:115 (+),score=17.13 TRINITY_DN28122_c0_g1_i1:1-345(+)